MRRADTPNDTRGRDRRRTARTLAAFAALVPMIASCSDCGPKPEPEPVRPAVPVHSGGSSKIVVDGALAEDAQPSSGGPSDAGSPGDAGDAAPRDSSVDAGTGQGKGPVRFIAVGDTGLGSARQRRVGAAMAAQCQKSGCDFVVMLGDNVYPSGLTSSSDPRMQQLFEEPYANVNAPFFPTLGNHDFGGNGSGNEFEKGQYEIDYTQRSQKWKLPAAYHHFGFGGVELFDLETNSAMFGRDATQRAEVRGFIARSKATWKIAFGHHPYKSNGPHGNAGNYEGSSGLPIWSGDGVKSYLENEICGKVDLYLSGHDHSQQWISDKCKGTELIVSGAGSGPTSLPGTNPTHFQSLELGFVYVTVQDRSLTADFVDSTGTSMYKRTITK